MIEITNFTEVETLWKKLLPEIRSDLTGVKVLNALFDISFNGKPKNKMSLNLILLNGLIFNSVDDRDEWLAFLNKESRESYMNRISSKLFDKGYVRYMVEEKITAIQSAFARYSKIFNYFKSVTVSNFNLYELSKKSKTLDNLLKGNNFDPTLDAIGIMNQKSELMKVAESEIKKYDPELKILLESGSGIRMLQLTDILVGRGLLPHENAVIPVLMPTTWVNGITTVDEFFVESFIARNANILSKTGVHKPSVFGRKISLLNNLSYLRKDEQICNTVHYVPYFVKDQKALDQINDRYIFTGQSKIPIHIDAKTDQHLIGTTVKLRDPIFCNSPDGVCKYCTGEKIYADFKEGVFGGKKNLGNFLTVGETAKEGQLYLSAKHNQTPNILVIFIHNATMHSINKLRWNKEIKSVYVRETDLTEDNLVRISKCTIEFVDGEIHEYDYPEHGFVFNNLDVNDEAEVTAAFKNNCAFMVPNVSASVRYRMLETLTSKPTNNIIERYNELRGVLSKAHTLSVSFIMRCLVKREDFSNPNITGTFVGLNSLKDLKTIGAKVPHLNAKKDILLNPMHYDPKELRESSYDILFESRMIG